MIPGQENEIHVQAATYYETLYFPTSMTGCAVHLTGGWNSSFTVRDGDPRATVLDGSTSNLRRGGSNSVVTISIETDALLTLDGFVIQHGLSVPDGGGVLINLSSTSDSRVLIQNCIIGRNTAASDQSGETWQLRVLSEEDTADLFLSDSLITNSEFGGVYGTADYSRLYMSNLTVADNAQTGIRTVDWTGIEMSLANSIAYGNGTDADLDPITGTADNLIGTDPEFDGSTYRLSVGSPAINNGTNSPLGGLGPLDVEGNQRIAFDIVDIGAYEATNPMLFSDGFESGTLDNWSVVQSAP